VTGFDGHMVASLDGLVRHVTPGRFVRAESLG
jgi:hypothetical protein